MAKLGKRIIFCLLTAVFIWSSALLLDRRKLSENVIRLHVVANSDSAEDQSVKLQVRDAVIGSLETEFAKLSDVEKARAYLQDNLPKIQETANRALKKAGNDKKAIVTFCKETFKTRTYETFSLPAGVYDSLRITIGEGRGQNWWCVTFPSLCMPSTKSGFEAVAVDAGFSDTLSKTLTETEKYEVRFFFLDQLGKLENILFKG